VKALRLHGPNDLRLHDEPRPVPGPGEVLVRVTGAGICGSDLHWLSEGGIGDARLTRPLVLGHEFAGVIETGERQGERVAADPAIPCGRCGSCREGNPHLCSMLRFAGHEAEDGAMRQFVAWPAAALHSLPEALSDADGAMLEPLGVAIHAVDLGQVRHGMSAAVFGCGPLGLLVLQVARTAGATCIIATDRLPHRLEAAQSLGAARALQIRNGRVTGDVLAATGGRGVDVAFEVAGENAAVETAIASTRPGGRVVLVGIPADDRTLFTTSIARRKELTVVLSRRMKHTYPRAIELVASRQVDVRSLVTHRFSLAQFDEAFRTAQLRQGLKVILES